MTGKYEIDIATSYDFAAFFARKLPAYVMRVDGEPIAIAGLYYMGGETFAYLDVRKKKMTLEESLMLVTKLRAGIKAMAGDMDLFVQCDSVRFETAPKLLKALGFNKTDRIINELEVWKWR